MSTWSESSRTKSTGQNGITYSGLPPCFATVSRKRAKSTIAGIPLFLEKKINKFFL